MDFPHVRIPYVKLAEKAVIISSSLLVEIFMVRENDVVLVYRYWEVVLDVRKVILHVIICALKIHANYVLEKNVQLIVLFVS